MNQGMSVYVFSRRRLLALAAGAAVGSGFRLYGFSSDFWNKKDPSEWTSDEINQLLTKSPWAKEVSAQLNSGNNGYGSGSSYPGGGGMGGGGGGMGGMGRMGGMGGMGGGMGGRGGRGGRSNPMQQTKGTVRWESAKPVQEALKTTLPEAFAGHYVISVSGFPLTLGGRYGSQDGTTSDSNQASQDTLDRIKSFTTLTPKDKRSAQPGVVQQQPSYGSESILLGFSKEVLALSKDDKDVAFLSQIGRIEVKTKFNLKDMIYKGDLAL